LPLGFKGLKSVEVIFGIRGFRRFKYIGIIYDHIPISATGEGGVDGDFNVTVI
jgi:hypothetical protein